MGVVPCLVVCCRSTEVILRHGVGVVVINTSLWHYRHWQCVWIVRVCVKERVGVADRCVLRIDTCAVSIGLVRVVLHIVLLNAALVAICSQSVDIKSFDWLPVQFCLEFQVGHIDIDIVVVKLVEDIETCIVASVVLCWIQCARCVDCVAVRVDIKIAVHCSVYGVGRRAQCSRSFLLTI